MVSSQIQGFILALAAAGATDHGNQILHTEEGEIITLKGNRQVATIPFKQLRTGNNLEYAKNAYEAVKTDLSSRSVRQVEEPGLSKGEGARGYVKSAGAGYSHQARENSRRILGLADETDDGNKIVYASDGEVVTLKNERVATIPYEELFEGDNIKFANEAYKIAKSAQSDQVDRSSRSARNQSLPESRGAAGSAFASQIGSPAKAGSTVVPDVALKKGPCNLVVCPEGIFDWLQRFNQPHVLVNAANSTMHHAGGIAAIIADKAGRQMTQECNHKLGSLGKSLRSGDVLITDAYKLDQSHQTKSIVHAVGPDARTAEGKQMQLEKLTNCYTQAINQANHLGVPLVTPAVSAGIFGVDMATSVRAFHDAVNHVKQFLEEQGRQANKTWSFPGAYLVLSTKYVDSTTVASAKATLKYCGLAPPAATPPAPSFVRPPSMGRASEGSVAGKEKPVRSTHTWDSDTSAGRRHRDASLTSQLGEMRLDEKARAQHQVPAPSAAADRLTGFKRANPSPQWTVLNERQVVENKAQSCSVCTATFAEDPDKVVRVSAGEKAGKLYHEECISHELSVTAQATPSECIKGNMKWEITRDSRLQHIADADPEGSRGVIKIDFVFEGPEEFDGKKLAITNKKYSHYLPNSNKGRQILKGLIKGFKEGVLVTIDRSQTLGQYGVVWNVHAKTNSTQGGEHGYPCGDTWYSNPINELTSSGITLDVTETVTEDSLRGMGTRFNR
ncbi:macro domain-containing protein [Candidatus Sororendozoicomonas aggregata]|uniref:macro domain-containing protein n=1 Tax=Candidatus Sororendozoicomonas aggregata TaxID=3073239 RepID=UPI002ED1BE6E